MEQDSLISRVPLVRVKDYLVEQAEDEVVREVPITIFLNDQEFITVVCSPFSIEALVAGFLFVEGIIADRKELLNIKVLPDEGLVWVETARSTAAESLFLKRCLASCCGRGRSTFYFMNDAGLAPVRAEFTVTVDQIRALNEEREKRSVTFRTTGGTHNAALCTPREIIYFDEDIGRHNAVDKVLGRAFLDEVPFQDKLIFLSGRISSEIVIKAARAGVPLIVSRAAPTDLALAMAEKLNIGVVGFVRGNRLNIYTRPERVKVDA
ncbi:MAG: formate dehydrogenase accessory sulfurtransferase FdhD [Armatimonadetes bacterium]|nr:formate dehydrogenase accessory sulfurtransferase FdhD [Armatimonadota bacterium]